MSTRGEGARKSKYVTEDDVLNREKKKSCIFLCFLRRKSAHKVPQTDTSFSNYNVFISTTSLKRIKAHPILFLSY